MNNRIIGKITATENKPSTCTQVMFWVRDDVIIRPFDIVKIAHLQSLKSNQQSYTYAVVQDLQYITDSASHLANYVSSDFGAIDTKPANSRLGTTIAHAEVIYNNQDIEMPVREGAFVEWADADGIRAALGINQLQCPVPAGYISMSDGTEIPIELDANFLIGPEGAHLNIAGISGLATKTSYAMFLMNSLQQRQPEAASLIIFNVKGTDLLAIDRNPINPLKERTKEEWQKCGLIPRPFSNVTYLYPFKNNQSKYTSSGVDANIYSDQLDQGQAFNYYYDIRHGINKLHLLFGDIEDPTSSLRSIFDRVAEWEDDVNTWSDLRDRVQKLATAGTSGRDNDITKMSWRRFNRLLKLRTEDLDLFDEKHGTAAAVKKQRTIRESVLNMRPGAVLVIDIEPLPDYLQSFVVGDVVETILAIKRGDLEDAKPSDLGTVVLFADELNKFAPKTAVSQDLTLTGSLLEITERGRSLGLVLFGAEQFRSGVHDRILGNCGTNVYGRTSPVEVAKGADYRLFPDSYKSSVIRLPKGSLLLQHAVFTSSLLKVSFPHPCYHQPKQRG